jgi:hypothetical protein
VAWVWRRDPVREVIGAVQDYLNSQGKVPATVNGTSVVNALIGAGQETLLTPTERMGQHAPSCGASDPCGAA